MARMTPQTKKFVFTNDTPKFSALTMPLNKRKIITEIRVHVSPGNPCLVKVKDSAGVSGPEFYAAAGLSPPWKGLDLLSPAEAGTGDIQVKVEELSPEGQVATVEVDYLVEAI